MTPVVPLPSGASEPSVAGPSRKTQKIRACDRCRRRKNKCDEFSPCSSCTEAKAVCTHNSIPQKRGPRPRERPGNTQLEQRLAHLEQLLASIPNSSTSVGMSEEERKEIHRVAQGGAALDHSVSGSSNQPTDDPLVVNYPGQLSGVETWRLRTGGDGLLARDSASTSRHSSHEFGLGGMLALDGDDADMKGGSAPPRNPSSLRSGVDYHLSGTFNSTANYDPATQFPVQSAGGFSLPINTQSQPPNAHVSDSSASPQSPTSTLAVASRRNLIYRDKEGHLKFVGPSSGLPLLGLLKELKDSDDPSSTQEPWLDPLGEDLKPNITDQRAAERGPTAVAIGDGLWARVRSVLSSELMDELIRGYFSVSNLLWPILHMPTFLQTYLSPQRSVAPDFITLVLSMCCLSSRYLDDPRILAEAGGNENAGLKLFRLCKSILRDELRGKITLPVIQTLFHLAVFAEGLSKPSQSLTLLSEAVTLALDMGLHRRVDDWAAFNAIEIEVRKRLFYAIYCMSAKASATFGRPPFIRLADVDVPEPFAVDDEFITIDGVGVQPADKPSVQAGFVAAIRLHMLLERTLEVINSVGCDPLEESFAGMVLSGSGRPTFSFPSEYLLDNFATGLPGDWTFTPTAINDTDTVRFFQRTRAYALQQFIRLLIVRHKLLYDVEQSSTTATATGPTGEAETLNLQHITQSALGIVGCYATIKARGRLRLFGVHAIVQLTQSGSALIGVILHTQGTTKPAEQQLYIVALEGLSACIAVLRHLGERRPAGIRSADILEEFARACGISLGASPSSSPTDDGVDSTAGDVPLLRVLPRWKTVKRPVLPKPEALDPSTLDWMMHAAFGANVGGEAGPFLPPPRFTGQTPMESGTWSSTVRSPAAASLVPDFSLLNTHGGTEGDGSTPWTPAASGSAAQRYDMSPQGNDVWPW